MSSEKSQNQRCQDSGIILCLGAFRIVGRAAMDSGAHAVWLEVMPKDLKRPKGIPMLIAVLIAVFGTFCRAFAAKVATNAQRQGRICERDIILKVMMRLRVWHILSVRVSCFCLCSFV